MLTSGMFVESKLAGTDHGAGMGISVGAPRGAGGRLGVVRRSVVADGPLEPDALLALEQALRVDLGLDRLELREAVRAPGVLLNGHAVYDSLTKSLSLSGVRFACSWYVKAVTMP